MHRPFCFRAPLTEAPALRCRTGASGVPQEAERVVQLELGRVRAHRDGLDLGSLELDPRLDEVGREDAALEVSQRDFAFARALGGVGDRLLDVGHAERVAAAVVW